MNLYEINKLMEDFEFQFDEETGELLNADELDTIELERNEKIANCIYFYKNKLAEAEALKAEKMRLADRQKRAEKQADRMKEWLTYCLNGEKWQSADKILKISYRRSDEVVADINEVGDEFLRYKLPELDKSKIKKALKNGEEVPGAELIEKINIQIQ